MGCSVTKNSHQHNKYRRSSTKVEDSNEELENVAPEGPKFNDSKCKCQTKERRRPFPLSVVWRSLERVETAIRHHGSQSLRTSCDPHVTSFVKMDQSKQSRSPPLLRLLTRWKTRGESWTCGKGAVGHRYVIQTQRFDDVYELGPALGRGSFGLVGETRVDGLMDFTIDSSEDVFFF